MDKISEWRVDGPTWAHYKEWYFVEEFTRYPDDDPQDASYTGTTVQIECRAPSGHDENDEPVWARERDLAHFIAGALNDREWAEYDAEAARINEREMWGPKGRPW